MTRAAAITVALLVGVTVEAQEATPEFRARATRERPMAARQGQDPTASGTTVSVRDRAIPGETAAELLAEAPGARPIHQGYLGAFSGVALRGAGLEHTTVLFGNLPIRGPDTGPFDFGLLPLAALDRIEIYRGGAPAWFSTGAIGGVVRLVPNEGRSDGVTLTAGAGSFGTGYGTLDLSTSDPSGTRSFASVGLRGSTGAFPYLYDNGTALRTDDDAVRRRENGDVLDGHLFLSLRTPLGDGELSLVSLGLSRLRGVPNPGQRPGGAARENLVQGFTTVGWETPEPRIGETRVQLAVGGGFERRRFTDREGVYIRSLGTADWTLGAFARGALTYRAGEWLDLTAVANGRYDRFLPSNALDLTDLGTSERWIGSLTGEARLHGRTGDVRYQLRPSVLLGFSEGRATGQRFDLEIVNPQNQLLPTFRLGGALAPAPWLTFAASAATGVRMPTLLELFGNRSTLEPNIELRPETSRSYDVGVTVRSVHGELRGALEVRGFWLEVDDMIRHRRTAQNTAIAQNIAHGRSAGLEVGLGGSWGRHVHLDGSLTWVDTRDAHTDHALPLRPALVALLRPELRTGPLLDGVLQDLRLHLAFQHTGANFADPANFQSIGERTWFSAGLRVDTSIGLSGSFVVRDLFDAAGDDLLGYPLPGRRWSVQLSYSPSP
jgi:vitamin B12 transporter